MCALTAGDSAHSEIVCLHQIHTRLHPLLPRLRPGNGHRQLCSTFPLRPPPSHSWCPVLDHAHPHARLHTCGFHPLVLVLVWCAFNMVSTPSEWPTCTARLGGCLPDARFAAFWVVLGHLCPPQCVQKGSKMGQNGLLPNVALDHLGVPERVFSAGFEASCRRFDALHVPETRSAILGPKRVNRGPKM